MILAFPSMMKKDGLVGYSRVPNDRIFRFSEFLGSNLNTGYVRAVMQIASTVVVLKMIRR